jgi:hypothetical protein
MGSVFGVKGFVIVARFSQFSFAFHAIRLDVAFVLDFVELLNERVVS